MVNFDEVLTHIGGFTKYQWMTLTLIGLAGMPFGMHTLSIVFMGALPDHWCRLPEFINSNMTTAQMKKLALPLDETGAFSSCVMYDPKYYQNQSLYDLQSVLDNDARNWTDTVQCSSWDFDQSQYSSTIVSKWALVCGDRWKKSFSQFVYMLGCLVGSVGFGAISDRFGRKPAHSAAMLLLTVSGIVAAFAPDYWTFVFIRCISAMSGAGAFAVGFVITMEIITPAERIIPGIFYQAWFAFGYMLNALLAYYIRDYYIFQLVISVAPIIFISYYWILWESPRWLMSQKRFEEAFVIIRKIAKMNGRSVSQDMLNEAKHYFIKSEIDKEQSKVHHSVLDLVRTPNMRRTSLKVFYNWFVISLVYYGLSLGISDLAGDIYLNTIISGLVEFPGFILCIITMNRIGRRWPLGVMMIVTGIFLLLVIPVPKDYAIIITVLSMCGKVLVSGTFALVYVFSAELFPTVVRNIGVGTGAMHARAGSLISPFLADLGVLWTHLPAVIYGLFAVTAGVLAILLPETLNQRLPETLEDGEKFGKKLYTVAEMLEQGVENSKEESKDLTTNCVET